MLLVRCTQQGSVFHFILPSTIIDRNRNLIIVNDKMKIDYYFFFFNIKLEEIVVEKFKSKVRIISTNDC